MLVQIVEVGKGDGWYRSTGIPGCIGWIGEVPEGTSLNDWFRGRFHLVYPVIDNRLLKDLTFLMIKLERVNNENTNN